MPQCAASGFSRLLFAALLVYAAAPARADDTKPPPVPCDAQVEAPSADQALCAEHAPPPKDDPWLLLPRALLALPRLAFRTVTEVLMLGSGVEDGLHVTDNLYAFTYSEKRYFDFFPTVIYDTGAGPLVGLRVARADAFGNDELFAARAVYGGRYAQRVDFEANGGHRFGDIRPRITLVLEAEDRGRFFGIGNGDLVAPDQVALPLDAQVEGPAVRTEFRTEQIRLEYSLERWMVPTVKARLSQLWRARDVTSAQPDDVSVNEIYAAEYARRLRPHARRPYTEFAIHWDTREALRKDTPRSLPGAGFRGLLWAGPQAEFAAPYSIFGRMGIDLNSFIDLYRGNRILHLRVRGAGVLGSLNHIPFMDLAQLGGSRLLRGYETGRFHGRTTLLGSIEYRWPIAGADRSVPVRRHGPRMGRPFRNDASVAARLARRLRLRPAGVHVPQSAVPPAARELARRRALVPHQPQHHR